MSLKIFSELPEYTADLATYFKTRNTPVLNTNISYTSNSIFSVNNTKSLGLIIQTNLSWRTPIDKLLLKLGTVCCFKKS
jgi:hypothetical protein